MLTHRLRRWVNIKAILGQRPVTADMTEYDVNKVSYLFLIQ